MAAVCLSAATEPVTTTMVASISGANHEFATECVDTCARYGARDRRWPTVEWVGTDH